MYGEIHSFPGIYSIWLIRHPTLVFCWNVLFIGLFRQKITLSLECSTIYNYYATGLWFYLWPTTPSVPHVTDPPDGADDQYNNSPFCQHNLMRNWCKGMKVNQVSTCGTLWTVQKYRIRFKKLFPRFDLKQYIVIPHLDFLWRGTDIMFLFFQCFLFQVDLQEVLQSIKLNFWFS